MRISNSDALLEMAGKGDHLFEVIDVTSDDGAVILDIKVRNDAIIGMTFLLDGVLATRDDLRQFRDLCVALGLDAAPEDRADIVGKIAYLWVPTHGGAPRFRPIAFRSFPYPSEPYRPFVIPQGNESTLAARRQARDISTRTERRAHGYGLLLEIEHGKISGVEDIEHSPVLWVEEDIWLEFEGTRRRGLRLVEWNGKGEAPANALRWAADIYIADRTTAAFVRAAIEEKLENDHGIAVASGEVGC